MLSDGLILVTGGHGKTGGRVVDRLRAMGRAVRAVSRSQTPRFDWDDRSTWAAVLEGVHRAYVTYQPDIAVPGAVATVTAFFAEAVKAGVQHLVFLSGRGEAEAQQAEQALRASGAQWTILRASWFCQNFSEGFLLDSILAGDVALPVSQIAEPFVDADDIADVAVAALTRPGHAGQAYELTGPHAISFPQAVAAIAKATGSEIRFQSISAEDFRAGMLQAGVPEPVVELVVYLFATVLDGRNERPTDGVQQALGRPARSFAEYVERAVANGAWKR